MKTKTRSVLDAVDAAHDWQTGQTWGHGGTAYSSTDTCRLCGLTRHWSVDRQNGQSDTYTFREADGDDLTLIEASRLTCGE